MRALLGVLLGYLLATLMAATSPIGTGESAHQNQLLDPLIPHVHFVNGQRIAPGATQSASANTNQTAGPALGAGAGAAAASAGVSLTPPMPGVGFALPPMGEPRQLVAGDITAPTGRTEAPPDPPPSRP